MPAPAPAIALWRSLLGVAGAGGSPGVWAGREEWIARLSPALIADLAPDLPQPLDVAQQMRLFGRYQQAVQLQALQWISQAGVTGIALKGFAAAFLYYPTPASRLIGDLDLLVRAPDIEKLVRALQPHGFRFGSVGSNAWGFLSDASFMPFHSPDGNCNIDLHVQPDSYPLYLGLNVDQVFAQARQVMAAGQPVAVPCAAHMAMIVVSNLAKDKFAPNGLRKLLDLARLLRHEHDFPWIELIETAQRARMGRALETTLALLRGLGTPDDAIPPSLGRRRSRVLDELLADWCDQRLPTLLQRLQREWLLAAEPAVALRLAGRRLAGLVRPRSGAPAGHEPD